MMILSWATTGAIAGGTTTFSPSSAGTPSRSQFRKPHTISHHPPQFSYRDLNMPSGLSVIWGWAEVDLRDNERTGAISMNHTTNFTAELDQTDEDVLHEVSDEALEAAASANGGGQCLVTVGPTVMVGGCC